jgi:hypothetical protein
VRLNYRLAWSDEVAKYGNPLLRVRSVCLFVSIVTM